MSEQYNTLRSNAFAFQILRIPDTVFRVTSIDFPDVSVGVNSTSVSGAEMHSPGQKVEFSEMTVKFIVDENLANYEEIYNWLTQQQFNTSYVPDSTKTALLMSDGTLTTLNNASVANRSFFFRDMFPTFLSGFQLSTSGSEQIECSVSFKFGYFTLA